MRGAARDDGTCRKRKAEYEHAGRGAPRPVSRSAPTTPPVQQQRGGVPSGESGPDPKAFPRHLCPLPRTKGSAPRAAGLATKPDSEIVQVTEDGHLRVKDQANEWQGFRRWRLCREQKNLQLTSPEREKSPPSQTKHKGPHNKTRAGIRPSG